MQALGWPGSGVSHGAEEPPSIPCVTPPLPACVVSGMGARLRLGVSILKMGMVRAPAQGVVVQAGGFRIILAPGKLSFTACMGLASLPLGAE